MVAGIKTLDRLRQLGADLCQGVFQPIRGIGSGSQFFLHQSRTFLDQRQQNAGRAFRPPTSLLPALHRADSTVNLALLTPLR